jgi:hypothetical protein
VAPSAPRGSSFRLQSWFRLRLANSGRNGIRVEGLPRRPRNPTRCSCGVLLAEPREPGVRTCRTWFSFFRSSQVRFREPSPRGLISVSHSSSPRLINETIPEKRAKFSLFFSRGIRSKIREKSPRVPLRQPLYFKKAPGFDHSPFS